MICTILKHNCKFFYFAFRAQITTIWMLTTIIYDNHIYIHMLYYYYYLGGYGGGPPSSAIPIDRARAGDEHIVKLREINPLQKAFRVKAPPFGWIIWGDHITFDLVTTF